LRGIRPVLLAWALVAGLTTAPYLRASLAPPPGTAFLGFFYFVDDQYNYLSYAEQAERGAFLFENKLVLEEHPPLLVNLEWWLVGRLSAALGGRPFLAWRLLGLAAAFAFLLALDRWLGAAGLPATHRFPALLLVGTAGGLGGLAWTTRLLPLPDALDLTTGLFPFVELLANPHFAAGTALLLWSLLALVQARGPAGHLRAALLGTVLGLVRPYDLVVLVAARGLGVAATRPPRLWLRSLAPLLGFAPVAAYLAWVFYGVPWFGSFGLTYVSPRGLAFAIALGPAFALALLALRTRPPGEDERAARRHLAAWVAVVSLVLLLRPVGFALQFAVGLGAPLLVLGALGLARLPPRVTLLAVPALSSTALAALALVAGDNPRWYVPPERLEAAAALRASCRAGDRALTPADIGLYVSGLTACRPVVSHPAAPGHAGREAAVRRFYAAGPPAARAALLDRLCATHVALPGDPGEAPAGWLGAATAFRRIASAGEGPRRIALYSRERPAGCLARSP